LPRRYAVRALAVVVCWAVKFVVVDVGLEAFPPLLFAAQRFGLTVFPAIFAGQFGLLSVAMNTGLPAGLASVVAPLQPVFTIPLAVVVLGERPTVRQVALVCLAIAGLGTIAPGAPTAFLFRQSHSVSRRRHVAAGMS
jgi:O-acetylserine/cysteine efflux transporter